MPKWDMKFVTNMDFAFEGFATFNGDISSWDLSSVTSAKNLFASAFAFNQNIESWDTSKITNMYGMFESASVFNQDIGKWDTSQVTDMNYMFDSASAFNQNINAWDVSNVTSMYRMFSYASTFNRDLGNWDTSQVTTMKYMFQHAYSFNRDIGGWDTSQVADMKYMFREAYTFNFELSEWKGSAAESQQNEMFSGADAFNARWDCAETNVVSSCETEKNTWMQPSPPPLPPPSPPPAQASVEASLTLGGYTSDTFRVEEETLFKKAISAVLNVSPGAIRILSVENVSSQRKQRKLLSSSGEIVVTFEIEASTYDKADSIKRDLVTVAPETFKQNLEGAGLTELTQVAVDVENIVLAAPPPSAPLVEVIRPPPDQTGGGTGNSMITLVIGVVSAFVVGAPTLILTYIAAFAKDKFKNKVRMYLLSKNLRWLADNLVPDLTMDLSELDEKVEKFMEKQKLPRLGNITPVLHKDAVKINSKDILGKGGFAVVYKGKLTRNSTTVAVKSLFHQENSALDAFVPNDIKRQMQRESTIICSLNHPNIIKILGVVPERGWIVMEYCAKGSLRSLLRNDYVDHVSGNKLKTSDLIKFATDVATGVSYLHSPEVSIVHGDLKADNVMVREDNSICVADFGLSEVKDRSKSMSATSISSACTVQWTAPELMKGKAKTKETDIFALGMTTWEIFERRNPFEGVPDLVVVNQILSNVRPEISSKTPREFRQIIEKSWAEYPKDRPSASQIAVVLSQFQSGAFGSFKSLKYRSTTIKSIPASKLKAKEEEDAQIRTEEEVNRKGKQNNINEKQNKFNKAMAEADEAKARLVEQKKRAEEARKRADATREIEKLARSLNET